MIIKQTSLRDGYLVTNDKCTTFLYDYGPGHICSVGQFTDATLFETYEIAEKHRSDRYKAGDTYFKAVIYVKFTTEMSIEDFISETKCWSSHNE